MNSERDLWDGLRSRGQWQQLHDELRLALSQAPGRTSVRWQLADALARLNRPVEALAELREDELPPYFSALKAGLLHHTGDTEAARERFEELAARPALTPAVLRRVMRYFEGIDPARAAALAARQQRTPDAVLAEAEALLKAKQRPEAEKLLRDGLEQFPHHPGLTTELMKLRLEGEPPAVMVEELDALLALSAHRANHGLQNLRVQALRAAGEHGRARDALLEQLDQEPGNHFLRANLSYVLRDLGDLDAALPLMEELLLENPADMFVLNAYFKTCRDHDRRDRASDFVNAQAARDLRLRRWWGTFRKVFGSTA